MLITNERLRELLVTPGHVKEKDFEKAVQESGKRKLSVPEVLVERGLILDEQLGKLMAGELEVPFVNLRNKKVDVDVLSLIPEPVARSRQVIAFAQDAEGLKVGMVDPKDVETLSAVGKRTGQKVVPHLMTVLDLKTALGNYSRNIKIEFEDIVSKLEDPKLKREQRDEMTVKIVDLLLKYGYQSDASDIHIEPEEQQIVVRFRVDGVLHDVLEMPISLAGFITTRIKILSKLRTDEHHSAQDGRFSFKVEDDEIDVRVSVVPVTTGENIVMRLLSAMNRGFSLNKLGLGEEDLEAVQKAIRSPHGLILVSGPTGSGKTTTIYAILRVLNTKDVHIASIEDPVEYDVHGISQIQVNQDTNLSFAEGLKSIVRQDPDIIFVGEIRDTETADIAVNSAMTGHLVLSTMHANDSATTLVRLIDMGVEPFLIASTVKVLVAQRLVRLVCESCRVSYKLEDKLDKQSDEEGDDEDALAFNVSQKLKEILPRKQYESLRKSRFYRGEGCDICGHTGFRGRVGIFEILKVTNEIRQLIMSRANSDEIMKIAIKQGMTTMLTDGLNKVKLGVTTLEEVIRVVNE